MPTKQSAPGRSRNIPIWSPRVSLGRRRQLVALGFAVALSVALIGCAPRSKAYPGPPRELGEIGIVAPAVEDGFRKTFVAVLQINGQKKLEEWRGGNPVAVHLLPGDYQFRVEYKQMTTATTIPLVDIVTMVQDAAAASAHAETNIAFPVKAGLIHRVHYDRTTHLFSLSRGPATEPVPPTNMGPPVWPPGAAAPCVETPDRSEEVWCELRP